MTPTETLDRVIFLPRHKKQLPRIRRLWLLHLTEIQPDKDYTLWAIAFLVGAWIASVAVFFEVMP